MKRSKDSYASENWLPKFMTGVAGPEMAETSPKAKACLAVEA